MLSRFAERGGEPARVAAQNFWTQPTLENIQAWTLHGLPHYSRVPPDIEEMQRMQMSLEVMVHFIADEIPEFNLLPTLARVLAPTLLIAGGDHPVSSATDIKKIESALVKAPTQYERLDDASHFLWRDAPELFFKIVRKFLVHHS